MATDAIGRYSRTAMARSKNIDLLRVQMDGYLNLVRIHREIEQRSLKLLEEQGIEGMTIAQATALLILVQEGKPITATRLATLLNVTPVTVGRFVRSLVQNKWIHRKRDPDDARAMLLEPTQKTYTRLGQFFQVTDRLMGDAYGGFSPDEARTLVAGLVRVRRNLYAASGRPEPESQAMR